MRFVLSCYFGQAEVGRLHHTTAWLTNLTYELFPAVQVGSSEDVISLQWLQQKVVPDAGDTVRGVRGLRRAGGAEVGAEALV